MKKLALTLITLASAASMLAGCSCSPIEEDKNIFAESITLNEHDVGLEVEEQFQLRYTVNPSDYNYGKVKFSGGISSIALDDTVVCTVDESTGLVTAVNPGSTQIIVSINGEEGEVRDICNITVKEKFIPVTSITVDKTEIQIEAWDESKDEYSAPVEVGISILPQNTNARIYTVPGRVGDHYAAYAVLTSNNTKLMICSYPGDFAGQSCSIYVYAEDKNGNIDASTKKEIVVNFVANGTL